MIEKGNYVELIDISNNNFKLVVGVITYIKVVKEKLVFLEIEEENTHKIHKLNNFQINLAVLRIAKDKDFKQVINWNRVK